MQRSGPPWAVDVRLSSAEGLALIRRPPDPGGDLRPHQCPLTPEPRRRAARGSWVRITFKHCCVHCSSKRGGGGDSGVRSLVFRVFL